MAYTSRQLPSGTWRAGFRHPVTGRHVWATKDEHGRKFAYEWEADAWAVTAEERAQRAASDPDAPATVVSAPAPTPPKWIGQTVGEYGEAYLARRAGHVERATRDKYAAHLSGLAVRVSEDAAPPAEVPMGLLTKTAVEQWVTDSTAAGVGRPSINGRLRFLRQVYADLLDADDLPAEAAVLRDPTRGIKYLTEDQDPDYVLTDAEEVEFLAAAAERSPQLATAALVALYAGLRWQEVYALRASAVDGDYLVVSHVIERGRVELRAFTKGKKPRVVPMPGHLREALAPFVKAARKRGPDALLFPAQGDPGRVRRDRRDDLLAGRIAWGYSNHRKREWLPVLFAIDAAREEFTDTGRTRRDGSPILQRRLVDPAYGFHALRHTYGSRLAAEGGARSEIARLMGHADERTTGRYIHAGDDGRRLSLVEGALGKRQRGGAVEDVA